MPPKENILCQLAEGLKYIHGKNIFHRDLKPSNVLIKTDAKDANGQACVLLKWGDFGLSRIVKTEGSVSVTKIRGTEKWFAPEMFLKISEDRNIKLDDFSKSSDVFASGLVYAYILLGGEHPYGKLEKEIKRNLKINNAVNLSSTYMYIEDLSLKTIIEIAFSFALPYTV